MPNIEDINGVAAADIGAFSGVSASNIAKVDGVDLVTFTGLLDTYTGAAAAYSVRQLKGGVTTCMRVRRDTNLTAGDDDEADVRFDTTLATPTISLDSAISNASAGVTALTLGEFLNVGTVGGTAYFNRDSLTVTASCFVDEWKDQTTNANHATQGTFGDQPQIHSGTVNTDLITENGKPAMDFDGSTDVLTALVGTIAQPFTMVNVIKADDITTNSKVWQSGTNSSVFLLNSGSFIFSATDPTGISVTGTTSQCTTFVLYDDTNSQAYLNSTTSATGTTGAGSIVELVIGRRGGGFVQYYNGRQQELIVWDSDQTSPTNNRPGIESNINGFYSIYP